MSGRARRLTEPRSPRDKVPAGEHCRKQTPTAGCWQCESQRPHSTLLRRSLGTRRSAVAERLQTAAFARLWGSLHAGLALPWSATVGEQGSGTECLLSVANVGLSKRLRPQHPPAALRKATVIDRHAAPRSARRGIVTSAPSGRALCQKGTRPQAAGPDECKGDDSVGPC